MLYQIASLLFSLSFAAAPVQTVKHVNLDKYLGTWFEVASIPQSFQKQCVKNTTAEYSLANNGKISVLNSCETSSGSRDEAEGRAKIVDKQSNAKLKVTFVKLGTWIFAFGGNYWVLDLDEDYSYAVVGESSRKFAWILSRTPDLSVEKWRKAVLTLRTQGYDLCKILTSAQDHGMTGRTELCKIPEFN